MRSTVLEDWQSERDEANMRVLIVWGITDMWRTIWSSLGLTADFHPLHPLRVHVLDEPQIDV